MRFRTIIADSYNSLDDFRFNQLGKGDIMTIVAIFIRHTAIIVNNTTVGLLYIIIIQLLVASSQWYIITHS